jgi:hypothetical protein
MSLGRALIALGVLFVVAGGVVLLLERAHLPLGRLPGDLVWKSKHTTVYFPLVTCVVLSVLGTLVLWLVRFFGGRR